jgi:hypothetical protein
VVYYPRKMTAQQLQQGYLWMYSKFYSFRRILQRLPASNQQRIPYLFFNFFYRKFGKAVSLVGKLGLMPLIIKAANLLAYPKDRIEEFEKKHIIVKTRLNERSNLCPVGISKKK